jgi:hypothetical protein
MVRLGQSAGYVFILALVLSGSCTTSGGCSSVAIFMFVLLAPRFADTLLRRRDRFCSHSAVGVYSDGDLLGPSHASSENGTHLLSGSDSAVQFIQAGQELMGVAPAIESGLRMQLKI